MIGTLTVRTAAPADLAEVDALFARSYPALLKRDYPPSVLVTAVPRLARAQPGLLASGRYLVAVEGAVVGAGGWSRGSSGAAVMRHLVTDHRRVRQGVARALVGEVLVRAAAAGCRCIVCQSTLTAEPFYASMGFRTLGRASVPLAPGIDFPIVEMAREL
ncbi:GNAT family N-acetyltransferase [Tranquillimonas alkanivorans]|uniref:Acetyltransferase, GNAT family n=1 Tax=Tranquillimonas alkanivorans TaxID=441119 RepID=A0A1I5M9Q6_9RHOB|nr:GNAT family N-acetyltransferase [Tranquillimonas alkanivorans]SFP05666.1 Acetyltransferase, GNAT family [Tranquillimonas alkanivorans]